MATWQLWDFAVFHWINGGWSNPVFDWLMPLLRNKYTWLPLYVWGLGWMLFNFRLRQTGWVVLLLGLTIFATDTISSKLIKNQVMRARPCQSVELEPPAIVRVSCGSGFSFTSSHATNHFGAATFVVVLFGHLMRRWKYLWWIWALLISLAQVYVGVHFPLDVIAGGALGAVIGYSMGTLCRHRLSPKILETKT